MDTSQDMKCKESKKKIKKDMGEKEENKGHEALVFCRKNVGALLSCSTFLVFISDTASSAFVYIESHLEKRAVKNNKYIPSGSNSTSEFNHLIKIKK